MSAAQSGRSVVSGRIALWVLLLTLATLLVWWRQGGARPVGTSDSGMAVQAAPTPQAAVLRTDSAVAEATATITGAYPASEGAAIAEDLGAAEPAHSGRKNAARMSGLERLDLMLASPGIDPTPRSYQPLAMDAAMDILMLSGQVQEVADLRTVQLLAPKGKLRLFRQVGGRTYQGDAAEEQFPWLFELVRWRPESGRDLGLILADLRQALELVEALEDGSSPVPSEPPTTAGNPPASGG